jgi:hypothetical protein
MCVFDSRSAVTDRLATSMTARDCYTRLTRPGAIPRPDNKAEDVSGRLFRQLSPMLPLHLAVRVRKVVLRR